MFYTDEKVLQLLVFGIWLVFTVIWFFLMVYKVEPELALQKKSFYGGLFITGGLGVIFYLSGYGQVFIKIEFRYFGVFIMALGLFVAIWARMHLGNRWSLDAKAYVNGFVDSGPYKYSRHPIYAGQLLMCLGNSLAASNMYVFLFTFIGTYIIQYRRTVIEERVIMDCDINYHKYAATKPRFFLLFKLLSKFQTTVRESR